MKSIFNRLLISLRRKLWALIVAYMLGMHNMYTGDQKSPDDIAIKIEHHEVQKNEGLD
jgi:hypothetical protein